MQTFFRFLFEFLKQFFGGFWTIIKGLYTGIIEVFNIPDYAAIVSFYRDDFNGAEWIFVVIAVLILLILLGAIGFLIFYLIRKYIRFRKTLVEQESMLEEIATLNKDVQVLMKEKQDILAMKVSQLGLKPDEDATIEEGASENNENASADGIRFAKLNGIDEMMANYKIQNYNNTFTLEELVELFRNFAASKLRLYYKTEMIRLFVSALVNVLSVAAGPDCVPNIPLRQYKGKK